MDVMKAQHLMAPLYSAILPRLVPGHSLFIHQDWFWDQLPWIHYSMGFLSEHFRYVAGFEISSAVFLYTKHVPMDKLAQLDKLPNETLGKLLSLFDRGAAMTLTEDNAAGHATRSWRICLAQVSLRLLKGANATRVQAARKGCAERLHGGTKQPSQGFR